MTTRSDEREEPLRGDFRAVDPTTGEPWGAAFTDATDDEIDAAVAVAVEAADALSATGPGVRAGMLRGIASNLEADADGIVETADRETGLGEQRLLGELARTTGQLRLFADVVEDGSYVEAIIDPATEGQPDLRRMTVPVGPVAMFGASNFPLAFSVPGGDTASILAAGCPVVIKAHPSHPNTSERCAAAIRDAVEAAGLPEGTVGMLHGTATRVGRRLVEAESLAAVAFTGSLGGGRALFDIAASRPRPIPVYAEMGSLNPVFVTPAAVQERSDALAAGYVESMTMGTGQFCTKPGLLFLVADDGGSALERRIADELAGASFGCLLNEGIAQRYRADADQLRGMAELTEIASAAPPASGGFVDTAVVFAVELDDLLSLEPLTEEHFGPLSIIVRCPSVEAMVAAVGALPGNLAAALHTATGEDSRAVASLQQALLGRVGRVVHDGWPTGVAVTHAQHHGGPYPATTSSLHTSVGSTAIRRFLRPVAFQDAPHHLLPPALRDDNPLGLWRLVDGQMTNEGV